MAILLGLVVGGLAAPGAAYAGSGIAVSADIPGDPGGPFGGPVTVGQRYDGDYSATVTLTGGDTSGIVLLTVFRMQLSCGPNGAGTSPDVTGNPQDPCGNDDPGVFGELSSTGTGTRDCAGHTFAITAPDSTGQVDFLPTSPVVLTNGQTCEILFNAKVLKLPTKDTLPNKAGLQTATVGGGSSTIIADPGSINGVGLIANGTGPGQATTVELPAVAAVAGRAKLRIAARCFRSRLRATVSGRQIRRVRFYLDRKLVAVAKADSKGRFLAKVNTRKAGAGHHRLSAKVRFRADSKTAAKTLRKTVRRCPPPRQPHFTG